MESIAPAPVAAEYARLLHKLEEIEQDPAKSAVSKAKASIAATRASLEFLRTWSRNNAFPNPNAEILFFKSIKPSFLALHIYWTKRFNIDIFRPAGTKKIEKRFLEEHLRSLHGFLKHHSTFYQYVRAERTDLDAVYFRRHALEIDFPGILWAPDADPNFSTSHDALLARIRANDRLRDWLVEALRLLETNNSAKSPKTAPTLQWTASKAGLVELIYALQSAGVCNNGTAQVKEIAGTLSSLFQVDLGNYYNIFNEIRLRKKARTSLLDQLKMRVMQKMDELDE